MCSIIEVEKHKRELNKKDPLNSNDCGLINFQLKYYFSKYLLSTSEPLCQML